MCLFFVYKFRDSLTVSDDLNASVIFRRPSTISREDLVADVVITSNSGNARYFIRHLYNIGKILPHYSRLISRYRSFRNQQLDFALVNPLKGIVSTGWGRDCKDIDGRKAGTPLAPGANPSYGAEQNGLLASLNSLTKLPYEWALDGISNTQTMNPDALGHDDSERVNNLVNVMDGYFDQGAHHLNVNVFGKDKLLDAMEHPEKPEYANFTIRVSGYAVKFIDLTKEQQMDVISRTFHDRM